MNKFRQEALKGNGPAKKKKRADLCTCNRYPKDLPRFAHSLDKDQLQALMPRGVRVNSGRFHGRWRLCYTDVTPPGLRSATWEVYGYGGAAKRLLSEAWVRCSEREGVACPLPALVG